jgi:phage terminase large subunit
MLLNLTPIYFKNMSAMRAPLCRVAVNEGGTSSSKTFSIIQLLITICINRTLPLLISVVSESMPHVKRGAERDFMTIMGSDFDDSRWNATNHIYNFGAAKIEFFSADLPGKVRGPRRDILYLNEANNITKQVYDELSIRTRRFEFIDHNPVGEYWAHELKKNPEVRWIHSTYKDALDVLPVDVVRKIEARKELDPNWWHVYGLGLVGVKDGLVYPRFETCDVMPLGEYFYGLDFGYTNDPSVLTRHTIYRSVLYSEELFYETGLTNQNIAKLLTDHGIKKHYDDIYADCAEPKSIAEIAECGFNIIRSVSGQDRTRTGIQAVNSFKQVWTTGSLNAIKEQRNYHYMKDNNGKYINKPIGIYDHAMTARMYAVLGYQQSNGSMGEGAKVNY